MIFTFIYFGFINIHLLFQYLNDNSRFPLAIFTLASKVIKSRVIHLEEMAKRRHRFNNLGPLEEALEVLTYIVIQDLQADIALLPTLCVIYLNNSGKIIEY